MDKIAALRQALHNEDDGGSVDDTDVAIAALAVDVAALDRIQELLDGKEWDAGTTAEVAEVMRSTRRTVCDFNEIAGGSARERYPRKEVGLLQTFSPIETEDDVTYVPFIKDGSVGYVCRFADGEESFLYLNPSTETDDGQANVFVYQGAANDPAQDTPQHYYNVLAPREWPVG